jgi:phosphotriesterase-related protein
MSQITRREFIHYAGALGAVALLGAGCKSTPKEAKMPMIQTVLGPLSTDKLGMILPHEHLFTDLRGPDRPGYAEGDPDEAQRVMQPYLDAAWKAGITALVECSTGGVGQNAAVLKRIAEHTPMAVVASTGVYREGFIPAAIRAMSEEQLAAFWQREIQVGIGDSGVRAGLIKMGVSNEGVSETEAKNLRAAARAAVATGAAIASHTSGPLSGQNALKELDILESRGLRGERFVWVHTQNESNMDNLAKVAARGAYLSFDALAPGAEDKFARLVLWALEKGLERQVHLSHDAGWYHVGEPGGGTVRGFTFLVESFLPRLRKEGVSEATIRLLTEENPKRAFALS